jgi:hypothetical protein
MYMSLKHLLTETDTIVSPCNRQGVFGRIFFTANATAVWLFWWTAVFAISCNHERKDEICSASGGIGAG